MPILGTVTKNGEKAICVALMESRAMRGMVYIKRTGEGRATIERWNGKEWRVIDEVKKSAQDIAEMLVKEGLQLDCVQCDTELANNHCNCEQRGQ